MIATAASTATAAATRASVEAPPPAPAGPAGRVGLAAGGEANGQSHSRHLPVTAEFRLHPVPANPALPVGCESKRYGYSIPRGPRASPERNCLTNWLSELKSSSAGPDSTIRPFQRMAMYSATRRADMMSWVITT
jgi:hypothetical protein